MNFKLLFLAFLLVLSTQTHPKNNLNGPGNIVIRGEGNNVDGRDNVLDGFYN